MAHGNPPHLAAAPSQAPRVVTDREEWKLLDCIRALYDRKRTLMLAIAAGMLAAALLSLAVPRTYRSSVSLELEGANENFSSTGGIMPATTSIGGDWSTYLQTQVEMLQQFPLLQRVAKNLKLDGRPEFAGGPASAIDNAVSTLRANLKIVPSHGSRIITIVYDARDPQLSAQIANNLAQSFLEESIASQQLAAKHVYESLNLQLAAVRQRLRSSESRLAGLTTTRGSLTLGSHPAPSALKLDAEADRKLYDSLTGRINDAWIAWGMRQPDVRILNTAQIPPGPYKPNFPFNIGMGAVSGFIVATGMILFREQSSTTVRRPGDAAISLALPELGVIPRAAGSTLENFGGGLWVSKDSPAPQMSWGGSSAISESFRATLSSILSPEHDPEYSRVLVVTSSVPMEGKTTVVGNLGISLTEIGKRVLLIDGDLRRPRLHKMFDEPNSWGLSDILREKNGIEELPLDAITRKTSVPHLYLLPSGAPVENAFGLLWSGRLARLLPRFRDEFDYVLLDAPPCLEFADARIMAHYADQLLLVVRANSTDRRTVQAAVHRLLLDGISMMGVILNCCDPARDGIYRYARNDAGRLTF